MANILSKAEKCFLFRDYVFSQSLSNRSKSLQKTFFIEEQSVYKL